MAMASRKRVATAVEPDDDIGCAFLHELSGEEQLRLRNRHLERKRKEKLRDKGIRPAPSLRTMFPTRKQANRVSLNNRTSQSDSDIKKGKLVQGSRRLCHEKRPPRTTGLPLFSEYLLHSAKTGLHLAKALPSVNL